MNTCERIREALPWYVTGSIDIEDAEQIAEHLRGCSECREEFIEAALVRCRYNEWMEATEGPSTEVWSRLSEETGDGSEDLRIDVGSLLLGVRLGIAPGRRTPPVHGELQLLGRRLPIIGRRRQERDVRSKEV